MVVIILGQLWIRRGLMYVIGRRERGGVSCTSVGRI